MWCLLLQHCLGLESTFADQEICRLPATSTRYDLQAGSCSTLQRCRARRVQIAGLLRHCVCAHDVSRRCGPVNRRFGSDTAGEWTSIIVYWRLAHQLSSQGHLTRNLQGSASRHTSGLRVMGLVAELKDKCMLCICGSSGHAAKGLPAT